MVIEVKDVQVGDEIIVSSNSYLKYLRVLRPIKLRKNQRGHGTPQYSAVLCSQKIIETTNNYTWGGKSYVIKRKVPECTPLDHDTEKYENLNYKTIWLVKR